MKAKLNEQGRIVDRRADGDPLVDGTFVDCPHYAIPGSIWDGEQWLHPLGRPFTDAEMQVVHSAPQLVWLALTDAERRTLYNLASTDSPTGNAALRVLGAFFAAPEIISRSANTKALMSAAIQLGVVADVARARVILNDPGFTTT